MQPRTNYLLGVDFGSDSVRCLVVDAADGSELASAVYLHPLYEDIARIGKALRTKKPA